MCVPRRGAGPADRQFLFTVYVHPHPDFPGFDAGSPFHGHELADRVQVGSSRSSLPAPTSTNVPCRLAAEDIEVTVCRSAVQSAAAICVKNMRTSVQWHRQ